MFCITLVFKHSRFNIHSLEKGVILQSYSYAIYAQLDVVLPIEHLCYYFAS